jgi:hypothetical protein
MSFWNLSDNTTAKGDAESSHVKPMSVIPDGTTAPAQIKEFFLAEPNHSYGKPCYEVHFKIAQGDFKNREVRLKIKCFDDKPTISDRGINMLKRIYDLCGHKPTHSEQPNNSDLAPMIGKIIGIKIAEFVGVNQKTGEPMNGNYVSEIHKADKDFETMTGVKLEVTVSAVESAFSRNPRQSKPDNDLGEDVPF